MDIYVFEIFYPLIWLSLQANSYSFEFEQYIEPLDKINDHIWYFRLLGLKLYSDYGVRVCIIKLQIYSEDETEQKIWQSSVLPLYISQ